MFSWNTSSLFSLKPRLESPEKSALGSLLLQSCLEDKKQIPTLPNLETRCKKVRQMESKSRFVADVTE